MLILYSQNIHTTLLCHWHSQQQKVSTSSSIYRKHISKMRALMVFVVIFTAAVNRSSKTLFKHQPHKWSNTLIQFANSCRPIVWVSWTILWGWRLKGYVQGNFRSSFTLKKIFQMGIKLFGERGLRRSTGLWDLNSLRRSRCPLDQNNNKKKQWVGLPSNR